MNLGILLPLGESLSNYARFGQDVRFVKYYVSKYCQNFEEVYLFSYKKEKYIGLPKNCFLVCPKYKLHRYIYGLLLPLLHKNQYFKCDVFRCFHPSSTLPALVAKIFFNKKFVFNYNYDYLEWARIENKSYLTPFLFIQQQLAFRFCNAVFVADEHMVEYVQKYVSKDKIYIIRNGVDTNVFKPISRVKNKVKVVLSVGRLETQKNYEQLIEALSKIKTKCKLLIIGRGTLKNELIEKAKLLKVNFEIIDVVPNDMLPKIYNQTDVYVQPSLIEAPVKTLLEAMSCGIGCVATNVVGIRDLISHEQNGLLSNLNANDIAIKIEKMLSNTAKAKKMGENARKLIEKKYDIKKYLDIEVKTLLNI